ncbi:MAG: hypothetical protein KKH61_21040 [Gammaproteobacteria bacterium]|nr:hypothetical protein [Gammaproteobacteria bacterium]
MKIEVRIVGRDEVTDGAWGWAVLSSGEIALLNTDFYDRQIDGSEPIGYVGQVCYLPGGREEIEALKVSRHAPTPELDKLRLRLHKQYAIPVWG